MPRMSEAEKQKSHGRILDAAARLLRERGIEATSVGDVMKAAGMTHGGFYRHFDSKDDLVAAAFMRAVDHVVCDMEAAPTKSDRNAARGAYIDRYLSTAHVHNRGNGCPLASLAADLARVDGPSRHLASETVARMAGLLAETETGEDTKGRAIMAMLLGTVALARLYDDDDAIEKVLEAGRSAVELLQTHLPEPNAHT